MDSENTNGVNPEAFKSVEAQLEELERVKVLLKQFTEGELAKYFNEILAARLGEIDKNLRVADDIKTVKFLQGEGNGVNFWSMLPKILVERMEEDVKMARAQLTVQKETSK
jgi:hypothetical protein